MTIDPEDRGRATQINRAAERGALIKVASHADLADVRARANAQRIRELEAAVQERDRQITAILSSTSWRMSAPLRSLVSALRELIRFARFAMRVLRRQGLTGIPRLSRTLRWARAAAPVRSALTIYPNASQPADAVLAMRVLIIGTLDLPQCEKYRVRQKTLLLEYLGVPCTVLSCFDRDACMNALQTHSVAIFYRVPGYETVLSLIAEAKRLGIAPVYEVDDLIFDLPSYLANQNIYSLGAELRKGVLAGVPLFHAALTECESGIASTMALAAKMKEAGLRNVDVIENGLDPETHAIVADLEQRDVQDKSLVRIFYGSGSKAHDADFTCAAWALASILETCPQARLRIVGDLQLPVEMDSLNEKIERYPLVDYAAYLALLAECDINLAPLEASSFNDCKSNIKFLEASILSIPSVCSPRSAFREVVHHGENGYLAESAQEWLTALSALVGSAELRRHVGGKAKTTAMQSYDLSTLAKHQLQPFLDRHKPNSKPGIKVLAANVYFSPQSFGGGTIVAEQMAMLLNARNDISVTVFSSSSNSALAPYDFRRHEQKGLPVISVKLPAAIPRELDYENARMESVFDEVLHSARPDVVHFHSLQSISASVARSCTRMGIPYVITLHDAWWLCERQFMVRPNRRYCGQTQISLDVCKTCVPDLAWTRRRWKQLHSILNQAQVLLAPSAFWRNIYIENGVDPAKILVNKNGVHRPRGTRTAGRSSPVRFGFVGGIGPVKGFDLVIRAFEEIARDDYELVLVDNTTNLGHSSIRRSSWNIRGAVKLVPAYTQETIDDFFSQIDVLLFPSQWRESFGLTVREALIRDKWVIATDSGGAVEDVIDGENGTIIPLDGNHDALREAIAGLLKDADKILAHVNPYKDQICTFPQQADELAGILHSCVEPQANRLTRSNALIAV